MSTEPDEYELYRDQELELCDTDVSITDASKPPHWRARKHDPITLGDKSAPLTPEQRVLSDAVIADHDSRYRGVDPGAATWARAIRWIEKQHGCYPDVPLGDLLRSYLQAADRNERFEFFKSKAMCMGAWTYGDEVWQVIWQLSATQTNAMDFLTEMHRLCTVKHRTILLRTKPVTRTWARKLAESRY